MRAGLQSGSETAPGQARAVLIFGALLMLGCRPNLAPVLNVVDAPAARAEWGQAPGSPRAMGAVRVAILQGLASKTWTVDEERMGLILASVTTPPHQGQIAISYNTVSYSIYYRNSSPGLKYDGRNIHRRYNLWVGQLRTAIDTQLAATPTGGAPGLPVPAYGPGPPVAGGGWAAPPPAHAQPLPPPPPQAVPAVPPRGRAAPVQGTWADPLPPPGPYAPAPAPGTYAPAPAPQQQRPVPVPAVPPNGPARSQPPSW